MSLSRLPHAPICIVNSYLAPGGDQLREEAELILNIKNDLTEYRTCMKHSIEDYKTFSDILLNTTGWRRRSRQLQTNEHRRLNALLLRPSTSRLSDRWGARDLRRWLDAVIKGCTDTPYNVALYRSLRFDRVRLRHCVRDQPRFEAILKLKLANTLTSTTAQNLCCLATTGRALRAMMLADLQVQTIFTMHDEMLVI